MTLNALGGKRNWRERILDLVSYAARNLAPCGLLLALQQVREIFEHDDIAGTLTLTTKRRHSDGDIQRPVCQWHLHLAGCEAHSVGAPKERLEIFKHLRG